MRKSLTLLLILLMMIAPVWGAGIRCAHITSTQSAPTLTAEQHHCCPQSQTMQHHQTQITLHNHCTCSDCHCVQIPLPSPLYHTTVLAKSYYLLPANHPAALAEFADNLYRPPNFSA
jgi:hypothetical protein